MRWTQQVVARGREQFGGQPAIIDEGRAVTFKELADRVAGVAAGLAAAGVQHGDRVMVQSRNRVEVVETYLALGDLGAVAVPLHWTARTPEITAVVERCGIDLRIGEREVLAESPVDGCRDVPFDGEDYLAWLRYPAAESNDGTDADLLFVLHTSATTGEPKGVMVHHGSVAAAASGWLEAAGHAEYPGGRIALMFCTPLSHGSLVVALAYLSSGATVVLTRTFTQQGCVAAMRRSHVSHVFAVPQMVKLLAEIEGLAPSDLGDLREVIYAAAPMPNATLRSAREVLGCEFRQMYGLTEGGGPMAMLAPQEHDFRAGDGEQTAVGRPIPGVSFQVRDEHGLALPAGRSGEVWMSGPGAMRGYWRNEAATAEAMTSDGWVRSGDLGLLDERGIMHLIGRVKEVINFAGQKIVPGEVEAVLRAHASVADACVVGLPSSDWGEVPHAFIVPAGSGTGDVTEELRGLCRERLAAYKRPFGYSLVTEIPRNPAGKVLRRVLRSRAVGAGPELDSVLARVLDVAVAVSDGLVDMRSVDPDTSVVSLGFDSVLLMRLLSEVQAEFGISWTLDLPPGALDSLRSIAGVVAELLGKGPGRG
ncbi:AMP-binding protein [Streptomyces virginiae]|uniref:AMP-binding protein n=1 Tax=Streptomyces virginiae TaxID=1961 RepID=UPI00369B0608